MMPEQFVEGGQKPLALDGLHDTVAVEVGDDRGAVEQLVERAPPLELEVHRTTSPTGFIVMVVSGAPTGNVVSKS